MFEISVLLLWRGNAAPQWRVKRTKNLKERRGDKVVADVSTNGRNAQRRGKINSGK